MGSDIRQLRILAVLRFRKGESASSICASLGKSRHWLYKWNQRFDPDNPAWAEDASRRPHVVANRTSSRIEEIVKDLRGNLHSQDMFSGAQAILWELEDRGIDPLPSLRSINRIIARNGLKQRADRYMPKGTLYPVLPSQLPNQTHQADFVGPRFLSGPIRFYSLNIVDTATVRCSLQPSHGMAAQAVLEGIWSAWQRIGIPQRLQIDNALYFFGSRRFPRGMGALIRMCLLNGVEPWFIPQAEPWRNGMVENFNERYQQRFLGKTIISSMDELERCSRIFEQRHNSSYRYSKLHGNTPFKALANSGVELKFPTTDQPPKHPLAKPDVGKYHLVRLIRSDRMLDIFGERFPVPPETQYQYVVATVDVQEQKLKLYMDKQQIEEFEYKMR
jgi:transposase InsO family protein